MCRVEVAHYLEKEATNSGTPGFLVAARFGDSPEGERIFEMR